MYWQECRLQNLYRPYHNVLFYDRAEGGKSIKTKLDNKFGFIDSNVKDLNDVVAFAKKKTGVQKVILVAHSMGTVIAAHYAAQNPDNVSAVILEGSVPIDKKDAEQWRSWHNNPDNVLEGHDAHLVNQVEINYKKRLEADPQYFRNIYRKIKSPTLILHGEQDFLPPSVAQSISKVIPKSELHIIPNAEHVICDLQPESYEYLIKRFMKKHSLISDDTTKTVKKRVKKTTRKNTVKRVVAPKKNKSIFKKSKNQNSIQIR